MGQSPPGATYNERKEGLPFFQGVADFNYRHPTSRVYCTHPSRIARPGDIMLSVRAPIGRVNVADHECAIGRGLSIVRPKDCKDARYIEFALRYLEPHWHTFEGGGSVFGNATRSDLEELPIPWLENENDRRAIAHILGTLDDKIELNRRMNETLEAMARAIFKSWFVDFDPVIDNTLRAGNPIPSVLAEKAARRREMLSRAKAEGRDSCFPKHIADLFPDRFVDSELGPIPAGWEVGTLGDIAEHPRRGVRPEELAETTPYIALEHMPKHCIALSEWGVADSIESNKFEFKRGEILFGKLRPYFHKVGVAPVNGVCSTDIVVLAPKIECWFCFVLAHLSSDDFINYANACSIGTKMPRTSWKDMARYCIAIPPVALASTFNRVALPAVELISASIRESHTLASLRDVVLRKLISGELRVNDAEQFIGDATK
jgi:type I restriction enzyme S subunit